MICYEIDLILLQMLGFSRVFYLKLESIADYGKIWISIDFFSSDDILDVLKC